MFGRLLFLRNRTYSPASIGCQHPVVTMAMPARLSNQRRQTPNQFERREHQADAAAGTRLDALVDQVFGVDFRPALQREGRASSIPQQPFQARAVGAFDAHAGIDREAATVRPVRHRLGVFRLKHTASGRRVGSARAADCGGPCRGLRRATSGRAHDFCETSPFPKDPPRRHSR